MYTSINFKEVGPQEATVSIFDRGFLYGDSVYEVIRTYEGKLFTLEEHFARLQRSAGRIYMELPFSYDKLKHHLKELVAKVGTPNCYLRLMVSRGISSDDGSISIDPPKQVRPTTVIIAKTLKDWPQEDYERGVRLMIPKVRRNPRVATDPAIKSGNYLNSVLAIHEARQRGFDDAVMLNPDGYITECTLSNVMFVKDGVVLNPDMESSILDGVTRGIVMELCRLHKIPCKTALISPAEAFASQECFVTSTSREVMPVAQLADGQKEHRFPVNGPVTVRLAQLYKGYVQERLAAVHETH